jgi:hypothetical protein
MGQNGFVGHLAIIGNEAGPILLLFLGGTDPD